MVIPQCASASPVGPQLMKMSSAASRPWSGLPGRCAWRFEKRNSNDKTCNFLPAKCRGPRLSILMQAERKLTAAVIAGHPCYGGCPWRDISARYCLAPVGFRRFIAGLGRTLIGTGILILLFVAYELWMNWTFPAGTTPVPLALLTVAVNETDCP